MEYNVNQIRTLADKYFDGGTTLAEEATLRDYFSHCADIPTDLKPCALLLGRSASEATRRSHAEIKLHRPAVRPLIYAITTVAAAVLVGIFVFVGRTDLAQNDLICYVNGQRITDPLQANRYALDAIELVNANLQKPSEILTAKTRKSPTAKRVEEMLNTLTSQQ
ncbi:MAG: hypothetical protein LBM63_05295 [Rikenellaceae bacterium]|jgi:hypothetical protein|nr:hypothetical protein [Rikenellaceae bacterium]